MDESARVQKSDASTARFLSSATLNSVLQNRTLQNAAAKRNTVAKQHSETLHCGKTLHCSETQHSRRRTRKMRARADKGDRRKAVRERGGGDKQRGTSGASAAATRERRGWAGGGKREGSKRSDGHTQAGRGRRWVTRARPLRGAPLPVQIRGFQRAPLYASASKVSVRRRECCVSLQCSVLPQCSVSLCCFATVLRFAAAFCSVRFCNTLFNVALLRKRAVLASDFWTRALSSILPLHKKRALTLDASERYDAQDATTRVDRRDPRRFNVDAIASDVGLAATTVACSAGRLTLTFGVSKHSLASTFGHTQHSVSRSTRFIVSLS